MGDERSIVLSLPFTSKNSKVKRKDIIEKRSYEHIVPLYIMNDR